MKAVMNKQSKLALFIAPFLVVGGYIASDQYVAHQANKGQLFNLTLQDQCQLFSGDCILKSGDMLVNITDKKGTTKVNTSFPVDNVTLSIVSTDNKEIIYELSKTESLQYWQRETSLRTTHLDQNSLKNLRIMVKIKGDLYLSELNASMIK
jgi:hypothetical protein